MLNIVANRTVLEKLLHNVKMGLVESIEKFTFPIIPPFFSSSWYRIIEKLFRKFIRSFNISHDKKILFNIM